MMEILMKAASFVTIIVVDYVLRYRSSFKGEDLYVLSKVVLKITLPAVIISNFSGTDMKSSMLPLDLLGLGGGVIFMIMALLISIKKNGEEEALHIINISGYNIGNFTLPFAQEFLGLLGVVATSLFDSGNALVCLGGSCSIASTTKGGKSGFSVRSVIKSLLASVPFDTYLLMTILSSLHLLLPSSVVPLTGIVADANAFVVVLVLGMGSRTTGDRSQLGRIVKMLGIRYFISIALALAFYFLLPSALEYRQALIVLTLNSVAPSSLVYAAGLRGDTGLSSAVNSLSITISVTLITRTLSVTLQLFFIVCKKFYGECIFQLGRVVI